MVYHKSNAWDRMVDRMLTHAVVMMMALMGAGVAAWALYTVWDETLRPIVEALGGAGR